MVLWEITEDMQYLLYEEQFSSIGLLSLEKDRTWKGYDKSKTVLVAITCSLCLPVQEQEAANEATRTQVQIQKK